MTPKQLRFVEEYLVDLNATQAAIRVGYSEKTARQQGARLLTNADIAAEVFRRQQKVSEKAEVTAAWVLERLKKEAEAGDNPAAARIKALELLGKHLALFTDKVEHSGNVSFTLDLGGTPEADAEE